MGITRTANTKVVTQLLNARRPPANFQHFHDPSGPKLKKTADSVLVEMANPAGTGKIFGAAVL